VGKIRVHEKALAHLSRGLYRSPASALRELVSNAWDANAKIVRIDTNAPHFSQLSIQDDGDGFAKADFEQLMEGGIGNSEKRSGEIQLVNGRPMIGRLGIGMLGIAQITGTFTITSKKNDGSGFRAKIRLVDLIRMKLDADDKQVVETSAEGVQAVDVGEYTILDDFDPSSYKTGTTVVTEELYPTFVQSFEESYHEPPKDWGEFIRKSSKAETLQEVGDYWRLVWELGASCPVPYVSPQALPGRLVRDEHRRLEKYRFKVLVDGIEIRKPVRLAGNRAGYTIRRIEPETHRVFGRDVKFHGYLAVQEGRQIAPDELRGIMVRIREVGIGLYDRSLLDYRINQGPRSRWLTGEIFVDTGLEDALNVDRDSFNRFHPEFRVVQRRVHEILQDHIFPKVYKQIERRSEEREKSRSQTRTRLLKQVLSGDAGAKVTLRRATGLTEDKFAQTDLVRKSTKNITVALPPLEAIPTRKPHRLLASAVMAIYDLSQKEGRPEDRKRTFVERLLALLAKW
jgi:Histidine kinase-, DNA gyrase B-, and HSP90-like ATPase